MPSVTLDFSLSFSRRLAIGALGCASLAMACGSSPDGGGASDDDAGSSIAADGGPVGADDAGTSHDPDASTSLPDGASAHDAAPHHDSATTHDASTSGCPALTYPSGVKIQTVRDATTTASYAMHLTGSGEVAPTCFLDVNALVNPDTNQTYPITVQVAAHFTLEELVGTEVSQGYGHFVLMAPAAVESLERFRVAVNTPVSVNSGFRSPKHQEAVCNGLCGDPYGCPGTCSNNSRHMFGDAFDLPLQFYTQADEQLACNAAFKFAYRESGTHLHIDQNPKYATCVIQ